MPSWGKRNRQWGRGFVGLEGRWGVDTRILGCFRENYFRGDGRHASGLKPMDLRTHETQG